MNKSMNVKTAYAQPAIEAIEIAVEAGFAASQGGVGGNARPLGSDSWIVDDYTLTLYE